MGRVRSRQRDGLGLMTVRSSMGILSGTASGVASPSPLGAALNLIRPRR